MPIGRFCSFQETSILYFTLRVVGGLPLLADEAVPAILRGAWLDCALRDRWFVGAYSIFADRVSLFASPARLAKPDQSWLMAWQEITTQRINEATRGSGRIWSDCPPPFPVASLEDYVGLLSLMMPAPWGVPDSDAPASGGCEGMIWQLLPYSQSVPPTLAPRQGSLAARGR